MKKIENFNQIAPTTTPTRMVPGSYVAEIKDAKTTTTSWGGEQLQITLDVCEGPLSGFYSAKYERDKQGQYSDNAKYKGILKINLPQDNDSAKSAGWKKTLLKTLADSLEKSNTDYHWDWDETKLAGLRIGILTGEVHTVIDGRPITYVEIKSQTCDVAAVRAGVVETPKPAYRNGADELPATVPQMQQTYTTAGTLDDVVGGGDVPIINDVDDDLVEIIL